MILLGGGRFLSILPTQIEKKRIATTVAFSESAEKLAFAVDSRDPREIGPFQEDGAEPVCRRHAVRRLLSFGRNGVCRCMCVRVFIERLNAPLAAFSQTFLGMNLLVPSAPSGSQ